MSLRFICMPPKSDTFKHRGPWITYIKVGISVCLKYRFQGLISDQLYQGLTGEVQESTSLDFS